MVLGRTWYQTCCVHLNAAGARVGKRSTACRHTSTMFRRMSIPTHGAKKRNEASVVTGGVSCNISWFLTIICISSKPPVCAHGRCSSQQDCSRLILHVTADLKACWACKSLQLWICEGCKLTTWAMVWPYELCYKTLRCIADLRLLRSNSFLMFYSSTAVTNSCVSVIITFILWYKEWFFWDVMPCGSCKNRRFGGT
jgi:hypothetical protein